MFFDGRGLFVCAFGRMKKTASLFSKEPGISATSVQGKV